MREVIHALTTGLAMTSAKWLDVHVYEIPVGTLIPTQDVHGDIWPERDLTKTTCPDPFIHVVVWEGRHYVEDGHHRLARAIKHGQTTMTCRVLVVTTSQAA